MLERSGTRLWIHSCSSVTNSTIGSTGSKFTWCCMKFSKIENSHLLSMGEKKKKQADMRHQRSLAVFVKGLAPCQLRADTTPLKTRHSEFYSTWGFLKHINLKCVYFVIPGPEIRYNSLVTHKASFQNYKVIFNMFLRHHQSSCSGHPSYLVFARGLINYLPNSSPFLIKSWK